MTIVYRISNGQSNYFYKEHKSGLKIKKAACASAAFYKFDYAI